MNSTQNKKIEQVKETTMIVGIDVGSKNHYFRAFNWRGIELTRKPVVFSNSMERNLKRRWQPAEIFSRGLDYMGRGIP